ncbi:MAG: hypothetical protein KBD01_12245 [Acidobacteria bacterium]|nr:hypothetical protein [Acidobacteriota bacterium]
MPRRPSVNLDRALRDAIAEAIDKQLNRFGDAEGRSPLEELRLLKTNLTRLQKKVDSLAGQPRKRKGKGRPGRPPLHEVCTVPGCRNEHYALGLCSKHYQQMRRAKIKDESRKGSKRKARAQSE